MQAEASATDRVQEAHREVLKDTSLQFDPFTQEPKPNPKPPAWLSDLFSFLGDIGQAIGWLFWVALALLVLVIVYFLVRSILSRRADGEKPKAHILNADTLWKPDEKSARNLLSEADALAAKGDYAGAAHLLLLRSVQDIEKHKPRALRVSYTSREIAHLKSLPEAARPAFELIGQVVERSLFGGAPVDAEDFTRCRSAYEAFALPEGWRA